MTKDDPNVKCISKDDLPKKIQDVLTKANNLFKHGCIVTYDGFMIDPDADISNEAYLGIYVLKIDEDINNMLHESINDFDIIKVNISKGSKIVSFTKINDTGRMSYMTLCEKILRLIGIYDVAKSIERDSWQLLCDHIDYNEIFVENKSTELKHTTNGSGDIIISKTLFPNVTKNVFNKVIYRTDKYSTVLNRLTVNVKNNAVDIIMQYYYL